MDGAALEPIHDVDRELDRRISAALEAGDAHAALPLLMDRHGTAVFRYCRRMLGAGADGDDVSQTAFMQAFEAIQRGARVENARAWLLGIARHRCLDRLQGRRRAPVLVEPEELERALDAEAAADDPPRDPRARQALDECLDALDARSRMVVLLRFHDQLSYDAISKLTGDRPGALRVRVARALPALRSCLEKKGEAP
jgi:RNA polymerase sigma-70 factor (ECF subfamily)